MDARSPNFGAVQIKQEFIQDSPRDRSVVSVAALDDDTDKTQTEEVPKKKLKGMNKKRDPSKMYENRNNKIKICPFVITSEQCPYGAGCCYEHDISLAVTDKGPNLEGDCYNYSVKGYCQMGLLCLYSHSHTTETWENIRDEERMQAYVPVSNVLLKDVQNKLWKKQYDFSRSMKVLKAMKNEGEPNKDKRERRVLNFDDKLLLAPLTTVGNLPFRRICKEFGADVTCSEMAMASKLLQGVQNEWALLKRHPTEDIFGIQVCGSHPEALTKCAQLISETCTFDFIDLNCGCPIDLVCYHGEGCALIKGSGKKLESIVAGVTGVLNSPMTIKTRIGFNINDRVAHVLLPKLWDAGLALATVHGRTREQRYTRLADWDYIGTCVAAAQPMPVVGNGDVLTYEDYVEYRKRSGVSGIMIGRGALIKPWIFTEIKEQRTLDISAGERLDMLRRYVNYGLENWGSDRRGVEMTRRFLLEWLSFLHRYIPVGVLENVPVKINQRPPPYIGRNELETLMISSNCSSWVKISEMLLGKAPDGFHFIPKHKANSY